MFIHKYTVGDDVLYMIKGKAARPPKIPNLTWRGRSTGSKVENAVNFLNDLAFSQDVPEEKPEVVEEVEEETPEKKETKKKAVQDLDTIAEELQKEVPVFAYLIDRVSDQLEGK